MKYYTEAEVRRLRKTGAKVVLKDGSTAQLKPRGAVEAHAELIFCDIVGNFDQCYFPCMQLPDVGQDQNEVIRVPRARVDADARWLRNIADMPFYDTNAKRRFRKVAKRLETQ